MLAIETSCDDTVVAVLSRSRGSGRTALLFNERLSSDHRAFGGVNPSVTVQAHNATLAPLGDRDGRPDFVAVTRGPCIVSNLAVGLNLAKGLALAWGVPLVVVHHMQAHALADEEPRPPEFPLTLLVLGGHTQLVHSASLTDNRVVADTGDIAVGNLLDQTARVILPCAVLDASPDVMYGRQLEAFAFAPDEGGGRRRRRRRRSRSRSRKSRIGRRRRCAARGLPRRARAPRGNGRRAVGLRLGHPAALP